MAWADANDYGIGTIVFAVALAIASRATMRLPNGAVLLLVGLLIGLAIHTASTDGALGAWSASLLTWVNMSPSVIALVFLPLLVFHSAFGIDVHVFKRELWQILALSVPGLAAATAMTAALLRFVLPYDWGWDFCFLAAAVLCATDPVAATLLLGDSGVGERLTTLIEGAALLAAGGSAAIFIAFSAVSTGEESSSIGSVAAELSRLVLGGPPIGLALGLALLVALAHMAEDMLAAVTLTVAACYAAYVIAEMTALEVSGLLAVVTLGLMLGGNVAGRVSPRVEESMRTLWAMASYMANAVVFFNAGLVLGDKAFYAGNVEAKDWGYLLLIYALLQAVRAIVVLSCSPVLVLGGYKAERRELPVLAFAGVRGAVGLTLALTVAGEDRLGEVDRALVLFYTTGVTALSLVVNGMLMGPLLRALQMDRATLAETEVFIRACAALELRLSHKIDFLKADRFVGDADWQLVWRYVPVMTANTYWTRIRHGNIALSEAEQADIVGFDGAAVQPSRLFRYQYRIWEAARPRIFRLCCRGAGGAQYTNLPPRLRSPWYEYHRAFSRSGRSDVAEELSLHRLNSAPQIVGSQVPGGVAARQTAFAVGSAGAGGVVEAATGGLGAGAGSSAALAMAEMGRLKAERDAAARGLGQAVERLHQAEREADKAAADDDEQLLPTSDSLVTLHSHSKPQKRRRQHADVSGSGAAAGGGGGASVATAAAAAGALTELAREDSYSCSEVSETSVDLVRALQETRARLLTAVKANYQERYRKGWLSSSGLRVLRDNVDSQMDHKAWGLDHWAKLHDSFTLPARPLAVVRRLPLLGQLVEPYIYRRLAFVFELASNFISAHEDVDILDFIREGPVAYQLAYEKNRQLSQARETLAQQLPVFPELARALKTEVAARYLLVRHRRTIDEFFSHGLINDKERDKLVHENNASRVRLDYHPRADGIPDRYELLRDVPFLMLLDDADKAAVIGNEKVCHEEFYSSGVELMRELAGRSRGHDRSGWFVVVRGSVRQTTVGKDIGREHGNAQSEPSSTERLLHAGTVFGLDGQLLDTPYHSTYVTASFAHVFFFDRHQTLQLAEKMPELKRGLWVTLATSMVRFLPGFRRMALEEIHELMCDGELVELRRSASAAGPEAGSSGGRQSRTRRRSAAAVEVIGSGGKRKDSLTPTGARANRLTVKSLSRARLGDLDDYKRDSTAAAAAAAVAATAAAVAAAHKIVIPEKSQVLLLRGKMFGSAGASRLPAPDACQGVCRIRDRHGPLLFSEGAVFFILSAEVMQRSSSGHQLLLTSDSLHPPEHSGTNPGNEEDAARRTRMIRDTQMALRAGEGVGVAGGSGEVLGDSSHGNGGGGPSSRRGSAYTRRKGSGHGREALVELSMAMDGGGSSGVASPGLTSGLASPEDIPIGGRHWAHSPEMLRGLGEVIIEIPQVQEDRAAVALATRADATAAAAAASPDARLLAEETDQQRRAHRQSISEMDRHELDSREEDGLVF